MMMVFQRVFSCSQFYPDTYEGRTGSIVPFSLRLLLAELPGHLGKPEEAIGKLYSMLEIIHTVIHLFGLLISMAHMHQLHTLIQYNRI